jgi:hypothetical protein
MEKPGAVSAFLCLFVYQTPVDPVQVVWSEIVSMVVLSTLLQEQFRSLRPRGLPPTPTGWGLNRSSPLEDSLHMQIGDDAATFRRLRTLQRCLRSGPFKVYCPPPSSEMTTHQIQLWRQKFVIPLPLVRAWDLRNDPVVNVEWIISENGKHPFAWARNAVESDDGSRLAIRVFKIIDGQERESYLSATTRTLDAVPAANTLVDLFSGLIVGQDYDWDMHPDRKYIFSNPRPASQPGQNSVTRPASSRVPFEVEDPEFIWGSSSRMPETVPQWIDRQRELKTPGHTALLRKRKREEVDPDDEEVDEEPEMSQEAMDFEFRRTVRRWRQQWLQKLHNEWRQQGVKVPEDVK